MALALFSTQAIFDGVNERCVGRYVQSPGFNAENNQFSSRNRNETEKRKDKKSH